MNNMVPKDLASFIRQMEEKGELCRINATVDPNLELATVVDKAVKLRGGGPALLFEHVHGTKLPVAANLFGSPERICQAFDVAELQTLAARFAMDLAVSGQGDP